MDNEKSYFNVGVEPIPNSVVHVGVLPYTFTPEGQLLFVLGKEHYETDWKSALKYGPFGGGPERFDKSAQAAAARECFEESMGFFGNQNEIYENILLSTTVFRSKKAIIYPMLIPYELYLPKRYNDVYGYFDACMKETSKKKPYIPTCPHGYLEKISISYFTVNDIIKKNASMRNEWYDFFLQVVLRIDFVYKYVAPRYRMYVDQEQRKLSKNTKVFY